MDEWFLPHESCRVCVFVNSLSLSLSLSLSHARARVCVFIHSLTPSRARALSLGSLAREAVCDADSIFLGARERVSEREERARG